MKNTITVITEDYLVSAIGAICKHSSNYKLKKGKECHLS